MKQTELQNMRQEYQSKLLTKEDLAEHPMLQFQQWFQQAIQNSVEEPNAFVLSTVNTENKPSSRVVLLKGIKDNSIVFYTNYNSQKGKQIAQNNLVAACFFWQKLHQQIRIEGKAHKLSNEESSAYFHQRPLESRIGAIVSPQSEEISSREWLEREWQKKREELGQHPQRPAHWGGYEIQIEQIEFWQGQPGRLHDRFLYEQKSGEWTVKRLAP